MNGSTYAIKEEEHAFSGSRYAYLQQWMMPFTLLCSDIMALFFSWAIAIVVATLMGKNIALADYLNFLYFIPLFLFAFLLGGLYSRTSTNPVEEIRKLSLITSFSFFFLITGIFILHRESLFLYSRFTIFLAGLSSLAIIPLLRSFTRHLCAHNAWWGTPVLILGAGKTGQMIARKINETPSLGLKLITILDDDHDKQLDKLYFPASGPISDMRNIAINNRLCKVLICMPGVSKEKVISIMDECTRYFNHVTVIPDLFGMSSLWVNAKDIGGVLALDIQNSSLSTSAQFVKRTVDVFLVLTGGFLILPLILIVSLFVKLDSPGRIFYGNKRVGKNGKNFLCWKFRSMKQNADELLNSYLAKDPTLQKEWDKTQKLQNDPRITKIGKSLRKWSIDELPQLWNVLKGEMSLVGPRPCFEEQLKMYGNNQHLYTSVKPGITGYWQVSGRNSLNFEDRVRLERYYVSNWSIWLDIYILAKTIMVVIKGEGAY